LNEEYVVVKFASGDQVITQLINETQQGILILRPIKIIMATVMSDGVHVERMMSSVYCAMSDQESFIIDSKHIMYVNRLHPKMIDTYIRMSKELYESNRFEIATKKEEPVYQSSDSSSYYH
jgi:hypothetical protein